MDGLLSKEKKKERKKDERNAALVAIKFDAQGPESRPIKIEEQMQTIELMHLHLLNISIPSDYRDADRKKKIKKKKHRTARGELLIDIYLIVPDGYTEFREFPMHLLS